jgi:V8-like Glu-specific endopeptidase
METFITNDVVKVVTEITKKLIEFNKLKEALKLLEEKFSPVSDELATSILMNSAQYNSLQSSIIRNLITSENAVVAEAKIRYNLLSIIDQVPAEIEIGQMLGRVKSGIYRTTSEENLEKILGSENHLLKINWLQKGIQASRSVCQVERADGAKGTGFVLQQGYLMTNFHVLPDKDKAATTKIIFDYEEDIWGNLRKTSDFYLDANDMFSSPIDELDYTYIKIKDNPANPLSQWGNLELETFSQPQIGNPVTIIQHPLGQTKQIALTANKIIGINDNRLLYLTDTERGSSGSPVFNNEWKVIALHHAGKTEEDGGLVIDPKTGEKRGANEGILIKSIVQQNNRIH